MMSEQQKKAFLDSIIQRVTSRKLLVWITATGLMAWGGLESGDWVVISGLYLGGQSVIDAIVKLKGLE
jgi:sorbitol-specific phosphotransferase system component IIC